MSFLSRLFLPLCLIHAPAPAGDGFEIDGWREATFSVSDLGRWEGFFRDVAGYEIIHRGPVPRARLQFWRLPPRATADELLARNPDTTRGYIRLLRFRGAPQRQIRESGRSWDVGGWFDVNVRVVDMDQKSAQMLARGWSGYSMPVQFSFGPFVVKEWLARGPDGVVLALIQRLEPKLEGWPHLKQLSRPFNATQIVADMAAAASFYRDVLGFKIYLEHKGSSKTEGPTVLGLPHNLSDDIVREVLILHPRGVNEGSVELLSFEGATGYDFASRAKAPNLGVLSLRFPVKNLAALEQRLRDRGVSLPHAPDEIDLAPYGPVRILAVDGPAGARLAFFEAKGK